MTASAQLEPDPRIAAMDKVAELADLLCGDVVLAPFKNGEPDWPATTRQSLTKLSGDYSEIQPEDIQRLGVLTDSFDRFCDAPFAAGASVLTLWNYGTPDTRQLPGLPCQAALELILDANQERVPIRELPFAVGPRPNKLPSTLPIAANENVPPASTSASASKPAVKVSRADRRKLEKIVREHGGTIACDRVIGATIDGVTGIVFISETGLRLAHSGGVQSAIIDKVRATQFTMPDPASLPERAWLFAKHYMRKYLSVTVGAGGGGKSAHSVSEVLAMVTGRPLLDPNGPLTTPIRVWYVNAEDDLDEISRRFAAAAKHFGITPQQIGSRLFIDSGRDQKFVIAKQVGREFAIIEPFVEGMVDEIERNQIDVVIVDPFVSTHEAQENDNSLMQRVAAAWVEVANEGNCAVELIHHIVKNAGEVTADSARGGGALKDKARSMRTINPMTPQEAERAGLPHGRGYFRVDFGKVNMVASGDSQWRRFASVPLMNGTGIFKTGDEIGVVEPWFWPTRDDMDARAVEARRAVVADVPADTLKWLKTMLAGGEYKADQKGKPWAGDLLLRTFTKSHAQAKSMLDAWIAGEELEVVELLDPASRKPRKFVKPVVAPTKKRWRETSAQSSQITCADNDIL